jgi:uncharacterized protein (DUF1697 family)
MGVHVALLRGINVGGKNKLPMKSLAAMFAEAGCRDVRTFIQSGNVVFGAEPAVVRRLAVVIPGAIAHRFGIQTRLVTRTAAELRAVARDNPFLASGADPATLHVAFLADLPDPSSAAALDPRRSPGDAFAVRGREIYLHCPNGVARSKLTNQYFDSRLGTTSTMRNWKTLLTLLALTGDEEVSKARGRRK